MRRLTHLVVLLAFVFSCGGQWAAIQCVAWANMIRDYSQMVPLAQAMKMTFSGDYPCAICKALAEKKNSDQQKAFSPGQVRQEVHSAPGDDGGRAAEDRCPKVSRFPRLFLVPFGSSSDSSAPIGLS